MVGALWSVELPLIKTAGEAHPSRQCTTAEPMTDMSPATFKKNATGVVKTGLGKYYN